jgi:hypothetical protein
MTSPQGVSKATGLHVALETLRLSARNTVAIGDAENDHELLRLAEVGLAVEWGSKALQSAADVVLSGEHPPVAEYMSQLAAARTLPIPPRGRRRLLLGHLEDGREFSLAVRGRNADPMTGAGDPIDLGLLRYASEHGADVARLREQHPVVMERSFDRAAGS